MSTFARLTPRPSRLASALALALALVPIAALADTYRVDLIVFVDKGNGDEPGRAYAPVNTAKALDPANAGALKAAGIEILPDDQFGLTDQWQRLKSAKRYQPLVKLAWLQKDPPSDGSVALRIKSGESFAVGGSDGSSLAYTLDGDVALALGSYLHVDTDLAYTQKTAEGAAMWRLREKRRVKRDELHHLDSARLGVLARVSKAQAP